MNSGCFPKGNIPWNKGMKGLRVSKATEFRKGENVGSDHASWKGGIQRMAKDCTYVWDGCNKRKRRPRAVYEQHVGPIPKGFVIYHTDGNKDNDDPANLEAIPRAELVRRNKIKRK
jgi:hypothetical protein